MRRPPFTLLLAFVLAAALAAGCGDDDSSNGGGGGSEQSQQSEQAEGSESAAKPKKRSVRAEMIGCIEDEGFEASHEGDPEKATNYTIEAGGKKKAEIIIHANRNDAAGSAKRIGEEKGINSIPFGRAEFRRADTATDTEAGRLANCVAEAYVH